MTTSPLGGSRRCDGIGCGTAAIGPKETGAVPVFDEDPVLRVLFLDSCRTSMTVLLLSVEQEIAPFDLVICADRLPDRPRLRADLSRAQQIAVASGMPILRIASDRTPGDAINARIREILGCPLPAARCPLPAARCPLPRLVPAGVVAELAVGVSLDDLYPATESTVPYVRRVFPLLKLGWGHRECDAYLRSLRCEHAPRARRLRRGWSL